MGARTCGSQASDGPPSTNLPHVPAASLHHHVHPFVLSSPGGDGALRICRDPASRAVPSGYDLARTTGVSLVRFSAAYSRSREGTTSSTKQITLSRHCNTSPLFIRIHL